MSDISKDHLTYMYTKMKMSRYFEEKMECADGDITKDVDEAYDFAVESPLPKPEEAL